jgi:hypothetical protein
VANGLSQLRGDTIQVFAALKITTLTKIKGEVTFEATNLQKKVFFQFSKINISRGKNMPGIDFSNLEILKI